MTEITEPKTSTALTIRDELTSEKFLAAIGEIMPKHCTPERMARVAIAAMSRNPKLAQCERKSFFNAMMTLSQVGLEPDGRHAHLIPFENRKAGTVECQLIIDYKGLAQLAMRTGNISRIHADKVCEHDEFDVDLGRVVRHKIDYRNDRGKPYAYYCIVENKDGSTKCEVMTTAEVEAIRQRSRASGSGPWVTDFDEMAKKTVFRRASKWIELSYEVRQAIAAEDEYEVVHRGPARTSAAEVAEMLATDE